MTGRVALYPTLVFLDSSANLALIDPDDTYHSAAISVQRRLVAVRARILTTNYVVDESYTLIMSELGTQPALRFLRDIRRSPTSIERVSAADEERAEQILERYRDHAFSYTDATSFAVMERFGITNAFGFDGDFREYRLILLEP